ncbi:hypothetical protein DYB37_012712 [Aphanomyces astaci]|uniref:Uncharacterized protein n=1 Tax=Aphanomyces astaci TaxID=112090 RepID=A0A3R6XRJ6_APHAT|nr:hypothetical protein DYB35_013379 [Aphanomyces astaci]RHZ29646.1 hypothetical protein DYB37_012712 [Aphanomyces astaci]
MDKRSTCRAFPISREGRSSSCRLGAGYFDAPLTLLVMFMHDGGNGYGYLSAKHGGHHRHQVLTMQAGRVSANEILQGARCSRDERVGASVEVSGPSLPHHFLRTDQFHRVLNTIMLSIVLLLAQ